MFNENSASGLGSGTLGSGGVVSGGLGEEDSTPKRLLKRRHTE